MPSTQAGFLIPEVELLDRVEAGQRLGRLMNLRGQIVETDSAPRAGRVVLVHACPQVHAGEPMFLITGDHPDEPSR